MSRILIAGFYLLIGLSVADGVSWANPDDLAELDFMVGSWAADGTEEHWIPARGGLMLGLNRSMKKSGKAAFEYLRIEQQEDGIYYLASPQGRPATPFKLVEASGGRAVFENPEHDFPQRIVYEHKTDDELAVSIEGKINGESRRMAWSWQRQR